MEKRKAIENPIQELIPSLPANQKKAADFFLEHIDLVALLPIRDVTERARVSEASIVRFVQLLGYKCYKELKNELSTALKKQLSPTEHYHYAIAEKEKTSDLFKLLVHNVSTNINDTIKSPDAKIFSQVVDSVIAARGIFCLGMDLSHHLSRIMTFFLRQYNDPAHYLSHEYSPYRDVIAYMNSNNVLIAFSFLPYSRETVKAIAYAKDRNIPGSACTDKKIAPIREFVT